jgi:hypothetical protein
MGAIAKTFLSLLVLLLCSLAPVTAVTASPAQFAISSLSTSLSTGQAGAHPDLSVSLALTTDPESEPNAAGIKAPYAAARDLRIELPSGLIGASNALGPSQLCSAQELLAYSEEGGGCPNASQVGLLAVRAHGLDSDLVEPVYMMQPPGGEIEARFGVIAGVYPTFLEVHARPDFGMEISIEDMSPLGELVAATMTIWGVPADPSHDTQRCTPIEAFGGCITSAPRPPGSRRVGLLTNPTTCGQNLLSAAASSWAEPQRFATASAEVPPIFGCNSLGFSPDLAVRPTSTRAGAPAGLDLRLDLPGSEGPDTPESSELRSLHVQLPQGMTLAPGAANGLAACGEADVAPGTSQPASCPDASRLGEAELEVPALGLVSAGLYLRTPGPGHPYGFWLLADQKGIHFKQPGELKVDRETGAIESATLDLPQVPIRSALLRFSAGNRALLANPLSCGTYLTHWEAVPWSGGPHRKGTSPFTIDQGCAAAGFAPALSAGTTSSRGGSSSPLVISLTRRDDEASFRSLDLSFPSGVSAALGSTPLCPETLAAAGACPPESRVGSVAVAAGPGLEPLWLPQTGRPSGGVYLAGPYRGAPYSFLLALPAQVGPFDFGTVVNRAAVSVDAETLQVDVRSDPLPQMIEGIPIDYRAIRIDLDRPGFVRNPTSCAARKVTGTATSAGGITAALGAPFSATDCAVLPFRPRLSLRLLGGLARNAHPALQVVLGSAPGEAAIARAAFTAPPGELLDFRHLGALCPRGLPPERCPATSRAGHVRIYSPLLATPLHGPIYLREPARRLPDLLADLRGDGLRLILHGHTAAPGGRLRLSFPTLPDVPLSRAVITLAGGRRGILVNSEALCHRPRRAEASFNAQSGKHRRLRPRLRLKGPC